jgi:hypothetical protein
MHEDNKSLEATVFPEETPEQAASRIIRETAPFAAAAISDMINDPTISPTVRLNASKYVIDRNLGPIGGGGEKDELEQFLLELQNEANNPRPNN